MADIGCVMAAGMTPALMSKSRFVKSKSRPLLRYAVLLSQSLKL